MLFAVYSVVTAQHLLTVEVQSSDSNRPLQGATVMLSGTSYATKTNVSGLATLPQLKSGNYNVVVSFLGYKTETQSVTVRADHQIKVSLGPISFVAEEIIVNATRASENTSTTYTNLSKADLTKNNLGVDLPYLLDQTPGVVVSSDAGAGVGYTGIRIRGSDATRVNVTINGVPLNNPESMGTFLVNLPDFASSVENIQIQRGVGTSTNGAGAFGASLNIQTTALNAQPYAELDNSMGSYNTMKNTIRLGTGLIADKFSFDGRLSNIQSDGYIDRAFSDLQSFFLTGAWHGEKSLLRAQVFSGKEQTYQAWNGVPEEYLATNRRFNEFTYEGQTDNYVQTHYQMHFSHQFNPQWYVNAALHYTKGAGYYEEYRDQDNFSRYGLTPVEIGDTIINRTDLVRQRWLDNDFYGATYTLGYSPSSDLKLVLGGAYNEYFGAHFGEIIWAQYASGSEPGDRYYADDAVKKDFNIFGRMEYTWQDFGLYADAQYRTVSYSFLGFDRNLIQLDQTDHLHFFNPKLGLNYRLTDHSHVYTSFAVANKEPIRKDYTESSSNSRPKPEHLKNLELGYRWSGSNFTMGANAYAMLYKDQLIITGEINDVGSAIRENVAESYRIGLELDARWQLSEDFSWAWTAALSDNKIQNFTEFVDLHDYSGQEEIFYKSTFIAMSPAFVGSSEMAYTPWTDFEVALMSKYVSRQYLDNTSSKARSLDGFFVNNLRFSQEFTLPGIKTAALTLAINNVFNEKYESNGYTWGHMNADGSRAHYNYYFPQATANFMLGLRLGF